MKLFLVLLATATTLSAQAPRITPAGDPSVRNDTIYRLAVDPKDHPEETSVVLLDDGVIRVGADGRGTKTYRYVIQILRKEAVEDYEELRFSYAPGHEKQTLNWVRVVRPDGTVISEGPTHRQESDVPAQMGNPVYADRRVLRLSISGVAPGTIIDYSYTTEEIKPFLEGDELNSWSLTMSSTVRRSRYIVDLPADVQPMIIETNLRQPRTERRVGNRRVYTWVGQDIERFENEEFAADSNGIAQSIAWALPNTWERIGRWYLGHAREREAVTDSVRSKARALLVGARSYDDSVRALHRYVAQDIRYVSISLGIGGYQPRFPNEVMATGFGDCKDKATLFVALMRSVGFEAYQVVLNSSGNVTEELPSISQFDHVIAAYRATSTDGYLYTDLTAELTPLGELPFGPQGEFGIVVRPDNRIEEVTFPLTEPEENRAISRFRGELRADGTVSGEYTTEMTGYLQYQMREATSNPFDSLQTQRVRDAVAGNVFPGATGSNLRLSNGRDLQAPPRMDVTVNGGRALQGSGRTALLHLPVPNMASVGTLVTALEAAKPRRLPISAAGIMGHSHSSEELELTLPEGWSVELPDDVVVSSPFGDYSKRYRQEGRVLHVSRTTTGKQGVYAPDRVGELIAFLKAVAADDASVLVVRR
jgi:transglutaminase-like putative cysteine protease